MTRQAWRRELLPFIKSYASQAVCNNNIECDALQGKQSIIIYQITTNEMYVFFRKADFKYCCSKPAAIYSEQVDVTAHAQTVM